jgi:hypothetical protein
LLTRVVPDLAAWDFEDVEAFMDRLALVEYDAHWRRTVRWLGDCDCYTPRALFFQVVREAADSDWSYQDLADFVNQLVWDLGAYLNSGHA